MIGKIIVFQAKYTRPMIVNAVLREVTKSIDGDGLIERGKPQVGSNQGQRAATSTTSSGSGG